MDKMIIVAMLMALALAVAAFQAFELNGLKTAMEKIKPAAASSAALTGAAVAQAPVAPATTGVGALPDMVGGC